MDPQLIESIIAIIERQAGVPFRFHAYRHDQGEKSVITGYYLGFKDDATDAYTSVSISCSPAQRKCEDNRTILTLALKDVSLYTLDGRIPIGNADVQDHTVTFVSGTFGDQPRRVEGLTAMLHTAINAHSSVSV